MTTYKEVFQLAQDKGYEISFAQSITEDIPAKIDIDTYLWGDELEAQNYLPELLKSLQIRSLIELTLIQKWLRDEHKAHITIESRIPYGYKHREWHSNEPTWQPTYEQALLEGINEALKLI